MKANQQFPFSWKRDAARETLRDVLLTKVLGARLAQWKEQVVSSPFLTTPRLMDFDWVVRRAPSASAATATISLTVQQPQMKKKTSATMVEVDRLALEVDRETLGEMVETFVGIRDQLAVMTNK